jgi:hypothetical protein
MTNETTPLQAGDGYKIPPTPLVTATSSLTPSSNSNSSSTAIKTFFIDLYETNHFLLKAILAIIIAKLYPPLGAEILYPQITGQWCAVMFIFCMAGILIKTSELGTAVTRWKFNIFVSSFNFFALSFIVYWSTTILLKYNLLNDGMADGMIVCSVRYITYFIYLETLDG